MQILMLQKDYDLIAQDECKDPALNTCHQYANCTDTLESYFCTCLTGYEDRSPNPKEPGRLCVKSNSNGKCPLFQGLTARYALFQLKIRAQTRNTIAPRMESVFRIHLVTSRADAKRATLINILLFRA